MKRLSLIYPGLAGDDDSNFNVSASDVTDWTNATANLVNAFTGNNSTTSTQTTSNDLATQLQLLQLQQQLNNQSTSKTSDNTLMYVGIGAAALLIMYMLMDNKKR